MNKILDCENLDVLYDSIESICSIKRNYLIEIVNEIDYDLKFSENRLYKACGEIIFDILMERGIVLKYSGIYFFHLTRTTPDNNFDDGLFSVIDVYKYLFKYLYEIISDVIDLDEWNKFLCKFKKEEQENKLPFQLNLRINGDKRQKGVFGYTALKLPCFSPSFTESHYLKTPEFIYHICTYASEYLKFDLNKIFAKRTVSKIVKFRVNISDNSYLKEVLNYVYLCEKSKTIEFDTQSCYSSCGHQITKENIEKVICV